MIPYNIPHYSDNLVSSFSETLCLEPKYIIEEATQAMGCILETHPSKIFLTQSCTSALELLGMYLYELHGSIEVLIPSFSFCTSASSFIRAGHSVNLVDCSRQTLCISIDSIKAGVSEKTKAVLLLNYAGATSNDIEAIATFCRNNDYILIEDAAQSIGSKFNGRHLGTIGDFGCFSFHSTKNISVGEGGALVVNTDIDFELMNVIYEKGTNRLNFDDNRVAFYDWHKLGSSYVINHFAAKLLTEQLKDLSLVTKLRRENFLEYMRLFSGIEQVSLPQYDHQTYFNGHIFWLILCDGQRDRMINAMRDFSVSLTSHYRPLHLSPFVFGNKTINHNCKMENTEQAASNLLRFPVYAGLGIEKIQYIAEKFHGIMLKLSRES